MVNDLSVLCLVPLFCASSCALFVILKAKRNRSLGMATCLLLDFTIVVILPVIVSSQTSVPAVAMQRLLLAGFLYFVAIDVVYLLFPSNATRLLILFVSMYLLLVVLLLAITTLSNPLAISYVLFAYYLSDEITLAAFMVSFLSVLLPLLRRIQYSARIFLDSKHVDKIVVEEGTMHIRARHNTSSANQRISSVRESGSPLLEAMELFRVAEYRRCIELCDAELKRVLLSKLAELSSAEIDLPTTLPDQISSLRSSGISMPARDILRLHKLCNGLTISSQECTARQAKWSIELVRRARRVLGGSDACAR